MVTLRTVQYAAMPTETYPINHCTVQYTYASYHNRNTLENIMLTVQTVAANQL